MKILSRTMSFVWIGVLLCVVASPLSAEVSVNPAGRPIVHSPEMEDWFPVRLGVDRDLHLNPWGDALGDGKPVVAVSPATVAAEVTWSRFDGNFEIAFAAWRPNGWLTRVLTNDAANDLFPRLAHDEWGNRFVAWSSFHAQGSEVLLAASAAGGVDFTLPVRVDAGTGGRVLDLVAGESGELLLLWLRPKGEGAELVLSEVPIPRDQQNMLLGGASDPLPNPIDLGVLTPPGLGGPFQTLAAGGRLAGAGPGSGASSLRAHLPLRPSIHQEDGTVWITWIPAPASTGDLDAPGIPGTRLPEADADGANPERHWDAELHWAVYGAGGFGTSGSIELTSLSEGSLRSAREAARRLVLGLEGPDQDRLR